MLLDKLKKMNEELDALKAKHLEQAKEMFSEITKELFEKHPRLISFGWKQYTPYFDDGDECIFSAHTGEPYINGVYSDDPSDVDELEGENLLLNSDEFISATLETKEDVEHNLEYANKIDSDYSRKKKIGDWGKIKNPAYDATCGEIVKDVNDFLQELDEEVLRSMFGDHVKITVRREGTEVESYEHD